LVDACKPLALCLLSMDSSIGSNLKPDL